MSFVPQAFQLTHWPRVKYDEAASGTGLSLREGMVFTIEPMLNQGQRSVRTEADGWTVVTRDGSLSAQFEHTVAVTASGVSVLTLRPDELVSGPIKRLAGPPAV